MNSIDAANELSPLKNVIVKIWKNNGISFFQLIKLSTSIMMKEHGDIFARL